MPGEGRPALHVILIGACVSMTTPISLMLLARAALERDRREGAVGIPAAAAPGARRGAQLAAGEVAAPQPPPGRREVPPRGRKQ